MKATDLLWIAAGAVAAYVGYRYLVGRQAAPGAGTDPAHYHASPTDPYRVVLNDPPPPGSYPPPVPEVYDDQAFVDPAAPPASSPVLAWQTTYRTGYRIAT